MRIEYHRTLIADAGRNAAFTAALKARIIPGESTVADIGAGTGILGLIAEKLGARSVYLYESAEVAGVAEAILRKNRARVCEVIPCRSDEILDPPRVDIVVSETLGNYPLEEGIIRILYDADRRHLKPGGYLIPERIQQFVSPVISATIDADLRRWEQAGPELGLEIDFSPALQLTLNNIYVRRVGPGELLEGASGARCWDTVDLGRDKRQSRNGKAHWRIASPTRLFGFVLHWSADLAPGIVLSTAPDAFPTHWEQLYLPLLEPQEIQSGELLEVLLRSKTSDENGTTLVWTMRLTGVDGAVKAKQTLDLEKGYLP